MTSPVPHEDATLPRPALSRLVLYGSGEAATSLVLNGLYGFALIFYTESLGLSPSLEGLALSPNQKTLILPIEATQILGSLAGIGEIAKAAFGPDAPAPRPPGRGGSVPSAGG